MKKQKEAQGAGGDVRQMATQWRVRSQKVKAADRVLQVEMLLGTLLPEVLLVTAAGDAATGDAVAGDVAARLSQHKEGNGDSK